MQLQDMYNEFYKLSTNEQKITYLRDMKNLNLPFNIKYDKLIEFYSEN